MKCVTNKLFHRQKWKDSHRYVDICVDRSIEICLHQTFLPWPNIFFYVCDEHVFLFVISNPYCHLLFYVAVSSRLIFKRSDFNADCNTRHLTGAVVNKIWIEISVHKIKHEQVAWQMTLTKAALEWKIQEWKPFCLKRWRSNGT